MKSDLIIKKIEVVQSVLLVNEDVDFKKWRKDNPLEFTVEPELGIGKSDKSSARLKLDVEIFDTEFENENKPFYIKVSMNIFFKDENFDSKIDNDILQKYAVNMVSMAFPYVRSHVTTITSISGFSNVVLPAINVIKLFNEMIEKDETK